MTPFVISKPSKLVVPVVPLSIDTTLLVFNPSNVHLATMSEHLTLTGLVKQSEEVLSLLQVPLNVDPGVTTIISPAAALLEADCSAEEATVMVHPDAPAELLKPVAQVAQSELLS